MIQLTGNLRRVGFYLFGQLISAQTMHRTGTPLTGLVVGIISAVVVQQLVYTNVSVAVVLGAVNALAAWLVLRRWSVFNTRWSLWGGLFGGVLVAVPMFGIWPVPALSAEAATAIGFLVIGFGVAMAGIGIELAFTATNRDKERVRDSTDPVAD
jgi:hypothetical protein